jgi:ClpX C4-type zinc finger
MTDVDERAGNEAAAGEAGSAERARVACSFCLKSTADVDTMVSGPGVFICNECVTVCVGIMTGKPQGPAPTAAWERDVPDGELLALLPKVAEACAQADRQLTGWVRRARARDITWARIGEAMGMTRQSAWERFSGEE